MKIMERRNFRLTNDPQDVTVKDIIEINYSVTSFCLIYLGGVDQAHSAEASCPIFGCDAHLHDIFARCSMIDEKKKKL